MLEISKSVNNIGSTFSSTNPSIYNQFKKDQDGEVFESVVFDLMLNKYSDDIELTDYILGLPNDKKRMALLSLIDGDTALWSKMNSYVNECSDKFAHIKDVIKIMSKFVKDGEVERKKFGEVMTPLEMVKEMLNTLPKEVWSNPDLKWLDPCNGAGTFPYVVIYKLMNGLSEWEPDTEKRYKHIVENMIYTCELQSRNVFLWLCGVDPKNEYTTNSYWGSFLDSEFEYHMKNVWIVEKFDIVIGNPPYQEMDGGNGASAKPIYNIFTEKTIKISDRVLFITPSRWFAGGKGLDSFRKNMMESNKIVLIKHFDDASKIFGNGVDISGGVSYFLYDNNFNGLCNLNDISVDLKKFDIVVKNPNDINLISKFQKYDNNISKISNPRSYFGIPTKFDKVTDSKISDDYVKCYFSKGKGFDKWVDKKDVKKLDSKYRVATPRANGDNPRFGNLFIIEPNECVSDSYITFYVDTRKEVESLLSYLKCNLTNYLLSLRKISNTVKPDTCKWIPIVPFDREWTDELLFEYFNLTEDEINLILER